MLAASANIYRRGHRNTVPLPWNVTAEATEGGATSSFFHSRLRFFPWLSSYVKYVKHIAYKSKLKSNTFFYLMFNVMYVTLQVCSNLSNLIKKEYCDTDRVLRKCIQQYYFLAWHPALYANKHSHTNNTDTQPLSRAEQPKALHTLTGC